MNSTKIGQWGPIPAPAVSVRSEFTIEATDGKRRRAVGVASRILHFWHPRWVSPTAARRLGSRAPGNRKNCAVHVQFEDGYPAKVNP